MPSEQVPSQSVAHRLNTQLGRIIADTEPGERLPSEPLLSEQLGVSRATLREAMRIFETQGIIRRRQGSGTFVNRPPHVIESGLEVLESIQTMAQRSGLSVHSGAVRLEQREASEEERLALNLEAEAQVLSVSRVVLAEQSAAAYLVDVLPLDILAQSELEKGFNGSVLDLLQERLRDTRLTSRTEISATTASPTVARALGVQRGDVLLSFIADLYTAEGRVIDHSHSYFLPGFFRFHVVRRVDGWKMSSDLRKQDI
jgi:GntR family transcriptional regulator